MPRDAPIAGWAKEFELEHMEQQMYNAVRNQKPRMPSDEQAAAKDAKNQKARMRSDEKAAAKEAKLKAYNERPLQAKVDPEEQAKEKAAEAAKLKVFKELLGKQQVRTPRRSCAASCRWPPLSLRVSEPEPDRAVPLCSLRSACERALGPLLQRGVVRRGVQAEEKLRLEELRKQKRKQKARTPRRSCAASCR